MVSELALGKTSVRESWRHSIRIFISSKKVFLRDQFSAQLFSIYINDNLQFSFTALQNALINLKLFNASITITIASITCNKINSCEGVVQCSKSFSHAFMFFFYWLNTYCPPPVRCACLLLHVFYIERVTEYKYLGICLMTHLPLNIKLTILSPNSSKNSTFPTETGLVWTVGKTQLRQSVYQS